MEVRPKVDDEVYVIGSGEMANRHTVVRTLLTSLAYKISNGGCHYWSGLVVLQDGEKLVSELPMIAKMIRCYVAVNRDRGVILSDSKLTLVDNSYWISEEFAIDYIVDTITCPNAERFDRQWGPDGNLV